MSGRPADPSYAVEDFAPDANYPAGAETWSSNPTKVAPPGAASVGFTPGQGNAAQYHNYLHHTRATESAAAKTAIAAVLEYVGQAQALNFPVRVTGVSSSQRGAAYASATSTWYMTAGDTVQKSTDGGLTWSSATAAAIAPKDAATDLGGNVVVCGTGGAGQYVYELDAATSTWTQRTVLGGHGADGHVVFDPISGFWVWQSYNAAVGNFLAYRSSDRATWTAATTLPTGAAGWGATPNVSDLGIDPTSGRAVAVARTGATTVKVATTDDGGVTWVAQTSITTTIDAGTIAISYNADEGAWYLSIGETTGTPSCEVWRSTDGAAWTKMATLAAACVHRIAGFGALLVATATTASGVHVVYSLDSGATWRKAGRMLEGTAKGVFVGPGAALALSSSHIYVGAAMGLPQIGVLA